MRIGCKCVGRFGRDLEWMSSPGTMINLLVAKLATKATLILYRGTPHNTCDLEMFGRRTETWTLDGPVAPWRLGQDRSPWMTATLK